MAEGDCDTCDGSLSCDRLTKLRAQADPERCKDRDRKTREAAEGW